MSTNDRRLRHAVMVALRGYMAGKSGGQQYQQGQSVRALAEDERLHLLVRAGHVNAVQFVFAEREGQWKRGLSELFSTQSVLLDALAKAVSTGHHHAMLAWVLATDSPVDVGTAPEEQFTDTGRGTIARIAVSPSQRHLWLALMYAVLCQAAAASRAGDEVTSTPGPSSWAALVQQLVGGVLAVTSKTAFAQARHVLLDCIILALRAGSMHWARYFLAHFSNRNHTEDGKEPLARERSGIALTRPLATHPYGATLLNAAAATASDYVTLTPLEVLEWLHGLGAGGTSQAVDSVSGLPHGSLDCVEFLHTTPRLRLSGTGDAARNAAAAGNLSTLAYLLTSECVSEDEFSRARSDLLDAAAGCADRQIGLQLCEFLHQRGSWATQHAVDRAALSDNVPVLEWLVRSVFPMDDLGCQWARWPLIHAADAGHEGSVRVLTQALLARESDRQRRIFRSALRAAMWRQHTACVEVLEAALACAPET